jgi:hypothetical protein
MAMTGHASVPTVMGYFRRSAMQKSLAATLMDTGEASDVIDVKPRAQAHRERKINEPAELEAFPSPSFNLARSPGRWQRR